MSIAHSTVQMKMNIIIKLKCLNEFTFSTTCYRWMNNASDLFHWEWTYKFFIIIFIFKYFNILSFFNPPMLSAIRCSYCESQNSCLFSIPSLYDFPFSIILHEIILHVCSPITCPYYSDLLVEVEIRPILRVKLGTWGSCMHGKILWKNHLWLLLLSFQLSYR